MRKLNRIDEPIEPKRNRVELELLEIYPYSMPIANVAKGLEAEAHAKWHLKKDVRKGNLDDFIDMRYPKDLTKYNTRLMNALEGRDFNELWDYESHRDKYPERIKLSKLLDDLKDEVRGKRGNKKAKKIISELKVRFKGLDGYQFKRLTGKLMGTKFDWMASKDRSVILYDAKGTFSVSERLAEYYSKLTKAGIPFYFLIWDKRDKVLRRYEVKNLECKVRNQYGGYTISRDETIEVSPKRRLKKGVSKGNA